MAATTDATEIREMAKLFRETADTADEQGEEALKEFTWAVMKLQIGGAIIGK